MPPALEYSKPPPFNKHANTAEIDSANTNEPPPLKLLGFVVRCDWRSFYAWTDITD